MDAFHVVSFDVEEHHRIEARRRVCDARRSKAEYARRMEHATRRLLDQFAAAEVKATFFIVGEIARTHPGSGARHPRRRARGRLATAGTTAAFIGSRPETFREDLRRSKDALEHVTGDRGRRVPAPTFSVVRQTGWAMDVLAECGFEYDSSIFPVRHDRYGIPDAPRGPFLATGREREILELPPLTYRVAGLEPAGGGRRLLPAVPAGVMRAGLRQAAATAPRRRWRCSTSTRGSSTRTSRGCRSGRLARWRTYVGMRRTTDRLGSLLREAARSRGRSTPCGRSARAARSCRGSAAVPEGEPWRGEVAGSLTGCKEQEDPQITQRTEIGERQIEDIRFYFVLHLYF